MTCQNAVITITSTGGGHYNPYRQRVLGNVTSQAKRAFTLAEVLITLTIVGVVAALTLPSLMQKIRFIAYKSQFKQEYSSAVSAIRMMNDENETEYVCYYDAYYGLNSTNCVTFWNLFFKQRKSSHICKVGDFKCRPKYKEANQIQSSGGTNSNCTLSANYQKGYVLQNGVIYYPWLKDNNNNDGGIFSAIFTVDINGMQGPNKYGYDVFYVHLYKTKDGLVKFSNAICKSPVEKGGYTFDEMLK